MSSPAEPNYHHQIPSNGIHSSNLFSYTSISATNTAFHSRSLPTAYNNEQTSPFRHLNSPRSDTFPTAFEFTSSSMPSPTLSPVSGANAYQELSSQQEFLSESSRRVKIPVPTITDASFLRYSTTFASSSDSTSLANPTTPKSKSKSKFTHMPVAMPMFPEPELPYSYSDLTPPTTIQPLLLTLLPQNQTQTPQLHQPSFSSVSVPIPRPEDTNTDPDITLDLTDMLLPRSLMKDVDHDHFSFIQSDDWHLSGGVDHEFDSYMHPEYGYISPISRRDRAGTIYDMDAFNTGSGGKQGETVHAALKRSRSDINEKERKETFMQRLISASGRAVGSRSIDFSSPVGERHVKAGGNQESTTMFAHRSLSFPFRDQSQPKYSQYEPQVEPRYDENMSSPLTSLSSSPATSPIPTQSDVKATNTSCTQTPAARRFTRKPHYVYLTPSQLHPSAADLVLTPSCTDQTPGPAPARTRNSSKTENGIGDEGTVNVKHRYRTRSKLAEVKGWTRVNRLRVGKVKETEESVSILRDLRKRKRGMKDASDATPDTMTMAKNKKKRLTDEDETENEEESVYVPSPIAFRRSTRIPMPVSSSSSPACLDTKSKAKSNHELNSLTLQFTSSISTLRTFPPNTPYHPTFPLFYRRFPVPSRTQTISAPLYVSFSFYLSYINRLTHQLFPTARNWARPLHPPRHPRIRHDQNGTVPHLHGERG